jgi:hypothetical protein
MNSATLLAGTTTNTEPVFVNLLRSPGIDSQTGGPVRQPYFRNDPARARICRSFKETRYRFSAWRAGTKPYLSYWPARLHRLAKSIPRNRFLGSINIYKYGLCLAGRYNNPICRTGPPVHRLAESIPGLLKRVQIWSRKTAGRYDNPFPTRFLAPRDGSKIPGQLQIQSPRINSMTESILTESILRNRCVGYF